MPKFRVRVREVVNRDYIITSYDRSTASSSVESGIFDEIENETIEETIVGDVEMIEDEATDDVEVEDDEEPA